MAVNAKERQKRAKKQASAKKANVINSVGSKKGKSLKASKKKSSNGGKKKKV